MTLTAGELTLLPSAVAALAIVIGYLGVRAANRNALKIAREERSAQRKDDFDAIRRATYAQSLEALRAIVGAQGNQIDEATTRASNVGFLLELIAPRNIRDQFKIALADVIGGGSGFGDSLEQLTVMMRGDLEGSLTQPAA